jgi:hypothetical protein
MEEKTQLAHKLEDMQQAAVVSMNLLFGPLSCCAACMCCACQLGPRRVLVGCMQPTTAPFPCCCRCCCRLQQAAEERHAASVGALKQGWAAELKRQAANWEAAAAAKQEAWRAAKVAEIKEQTVKVCGRGVALTRFYTTQPPGCHCAS